MSTPPLTHIIPSRIVLQAEADYQNNLNRRNQVSPISSIQKIHRNATDLTDIEIIKFVA